MSLWQNTDEDTSAPKYHVAGGYGVSANGQVLYDNTTQDAFVPGEALGVFGVDAVEQDVPASTKGGHAGWILRKEGSGGRAGRVQVETLVAMGSMTGDGADDAIYPDFYITLGPVGNRNTTTGAGVTGLFSILATISAGGGALSYQWQYKAPANPTYLDLVNGAVWSGVLTNSLTIAAGHLLTSDTGNLYRCVVSAASATTETSSAGLLTVV